MQRARPTHIEIVPSALLNNLNRVKQYAPGKKIMAMVKANAYGCQLPAVLPVLEGQVYAFGVASLDEAIILRNLGSRSECIILHGIFSQAELPALLQYKLQTVIHDARQLQWIVNTPLPAPIKVWVKIDTGMHRLGFNPEEVYEIVNKLINCSWIEKEIGLMTHFASAEETDNPSSQQQLELFRQLRTPNAKFIRSVANSAAIISQLGNDADVVRPGIMLYGVSPFADRSASSLGLLPVMRVLSAITTIHEFPTGAKIGYGATWECKKSSRIAIVPVGYGDGYPRHLHNVAYVWVNGFKAPVVGRVSMDMLTVDISHCPGVTEGNLVELWGQYIPVADVARAANTSPYEILCQVTKRLL